MKKTSLFMLAAGSLAMLACAKPVLRQFDEITRRRSAEGKTETDSGMPRVMGEQDMQPVAQESSMVADGTQRHAPDSAPAAQDRPADTLPRKDGDFAPPVGA
ncbi:hypothetical protein I5R65_23510 [Herbaspirillum sp. AP02]|uniref:hypothetical protein n=1 Tax=unclassified Herbaspirillum TaxID=2624150 RepID=UPI0015DA21FD|nr:MULTISPECIES: hypothetical protein [unclassified Herbaspirillum]MBG7622454.1 hypothetical protein [Herbaspirillum sp. AP02]NZD70176.1 hypothetical protein [Herbaspirillum sp. AP21]